MNALWMRQILAVVRIELRKNLLSWRALGLYLLAGLPVMLLTMTGAKSGQRRETPLEAVPSHDRTWIVGFWVGSRIRT